MIVILDGRQDGRLDVCLSHGWIVQQESRAVAKITARCAQCIVYPKIGESLDTPGVPFLENFNGHFVRMDPLNVPPKFEIRVFTRSCDNRVPEKIGQSL